MKITKIITTVGVSCTVVLSANAAVLIDSTFANGNGSFEFDSGGTALGSPGAPGLWVTNGDTVLTIDGTDTIEEVDTVFANNTVSSDGDYSLEVTPDPNGALTNQGGILNTGHTVGLSDQFSFSFDWQKTNNALGAAGFDVFVFTSSDNTLGGTLTSIFKDNLASGPPMTSFNTVNLTAADFNVTATNAGQELWVAFAPGGFTGASNTSRLNIDNLNLSVVPEPSSSALAAIGFGTLMFCRRRRA